MRSKGHGSSNMGTLSSCQSHMNMSRVCKAKITPAEKMICPKCTSDARILHTRTTTIGSAANAKRPTKSRNAIIGARGGSSIAVAECHPTVFSSTRCPVARVAPRGGDAGSRLPVRLSQGRREGTGKGAVCCQSSARGPRRTGPAGLSSVALRTGGQASSGIHAAAGEVGEHFEDVGEHFKVFANILLFALTSNTAPADATHSLV